MEFKLICHHVRTDHNDNDFENIFRIGTYGLNHECNVHGSRYPALYIDTKLMKFEFGITDKDFCWRQYPFSSPCNQCLTVEIDHIYHFELKFNETNVNITYDHYDKNMKAMELKQIMYNGDRKGVTNKNNLCKYLDIIISDPLNIAADVTLWDIEIHSFDTGSYCKNLQEYNSMHHEL